MERRRLIQRKPPASPYPRKPLCPSLSKNQAQLETAAAARLALSSVAAIAIRSLPHPRPAPSSPLRPPPPASAAPAAVLAAARAHPSRHLLRELRCASPVVLNCCRLCLTSANLKQALSPRSAQASSRASEGSRSCMLSTATSESCCLTGTETFIRLSHTAVTMPAARSTRPPIVDRDGKLNCHPRGQLRFPQWSEQSEAEAQVG